MGERPSHNIIRKNAATGKWETFGACWEREDGKMSVSIELVRGGEKIKGLLVKNTPPPTVTGPVKGFGGNTAVGAPMPTRNVAEDDGDEIPF